MANNTFQNPNSTFPTQEAEIETSGQILEAYTVVLSVTCHLLSMFFGGSSSITVLFGIMARSNINKYSYLLILTFLIGCCCLNFIYTPLEVADLLIYHSTYIHPTLQFVAAKSIVYLFLLALINAVIISLALEGFLRTHGCFGGLLQKMWPMLSTILTLLVSFILAGILIGPTTNQINFESRNYVLMHHDVRSFFLALLIFLGSVALLAFICLIIILLRSNVYWEDGKLHLKKKKLNLALPEFLISQSNNACEDVESSFDNDQSRTPSPQTPKLLTVVGQIKGEDAAPIPDLPQSTPPRPTGNRLGINMSQVLGRRRHTICQISDSSSPSAPPLDPIAKAKQYNYVRKFSVDVSALQAQLQNPKVFKEAPYQSDIDLAKKADNSSGPKPLLPLKPLTIKLDEREEPANACERNKKADVPASGTLPIPPPPVIMVSNDDAVPENEEGENTMTVNSENVNGKPEVFIQPPINVQKPASLPLKESCIDDLTSAPTLESAMTDPSESETEGQKIVRLALCMALTFIITVLPVIITEALRSRLSTHAFVNISTCIIAVSTIQTIVYPNLLVCIDDVIHKAIQKLKARVRKHLACSSKLDHQHAHAEDTSSTSQV